MRDEPRLVVITEAAWTFDLAGTCAFCGKKVTRAVTFHAPTQPQATAKADRAMAEGIWHRKCGGS